MALFGTVRRVNFSHENSTNNLEENMEIKEIIQKIKATIATT